ncbi:MAG: hypothetical protein HY260_11470 [Chloroflexi bacterium]|nr:hypothetical protein [Chloroflexota bacterium]
MFDFLLSALNFLTRLLITLNQILTAGIAITTLSLLLYSLTFNLRDRVARSFSLLMACIVVVFSADVAASLSVSLSDAEAWLRLQWLGIAFIPATGFHFSDALLATTGRPSRGRRRMGIRLGYAASTALWVLAASTDIIVQSGASDASAVHLQPGPLFPLFALSFVGASALVIVNLYRAYRRCLTSTTRRRMGYLLVASIAPAIGTFPYLLAVGGRPASLHPFLFWLTVVLGNLAVGGLLTLMAYSVAFFGSPQPDRVIRSRLFQWFLRGPVVVSSALAVMVIVNRAAAWLGAEAWKITPFFLVATLLGLQFAINLARIPFERRLFYGGGKDREDVWRLQRLEERLLTTGDVHDFLESVLAAACDLLRVPSAFVAAVGPEGMSVEVRVGPDDPESDKAPWPLSIIPASNGAQPADVQATVQPSPDSGLFVWRDFWVIPLHARPDAEAGGERETVIGLLGLRARAPHPDLNDEEREVLARLAERAAAALADRVLQQRVFTALDALMPQIDTIQRLRAAARYSGATALMSPNGLPPDTDLAQVVKDALNHYWGGPKLTASPLLRLRVVENALRDHDGNAANAVRAVLLRAIESIRPEGQRKFTGDWLLYNILEMKFLQGRRVRDVAMRLAVSEADLYRKQRVALEEVARAIAGMERDAAERVAERNSQ